MARSKKTPRIGEIQYERIFDWSGGMNNAVNPVLLKDNESPLLENASLDEKGTLFPRMGSRDRYSEQIGNEPVTGIGTYYKSDGTSRLLISAGTKLYEDNPHIMDIFENQDEFEQGTIAGSASITKKPNSVVNEEDPEDVELKIDTEEEWDTGEKDNIVVNPDGTISLAKAGEDIEHKDEKEEDFDAGTFDNVEFIPGEDVALTESGEDFEEGELDGVVTGEDGLELEEVESPTFARASKAYLSDGTEVDAGVPRFEQGKFDRAVLVEEWTTNLCTNPSFETDLTGWVHLGGGTSSRVTDQKYYGNACLKISTTDTENASQRWYAVANPGNYAGKTVSLSCMAKTSIADKLILSIREYDGNNYKWSNSSYHPGDGTWKKLSLTTTLRSTVTDLQLQLVAEAGIIGDFWCDGVLFEEKPYPTSFTPGTRSPETLTIPTAGVLNPQEGAVAFWYKTGRSGSIAPSGKHDNFFGLNSKLWSIWQANGVENKLNFMAGDSWSGPVVQVPVNWDEGDILFIVARWKLPDIYLDVWNYTKGTYAFGSATGVTYTGSPTLAYINCGFGSFAGYNNGLIDELAIFDYAPTDEEIQAWYEADAPIPITGHTTYLLRFDNDFVAGKGGARKSLPLDLSSVGTVKTSGISWQATFPAREVDQLAFTRDSKAYLSDGTEVDAGVPRFGQGKFDKAVLVEEGTTNRLSASLDFVTGWESISGASTIVTPGQADPFGGTKAYRIRTTGGTSTTKYLTWVDRPSVDGLPYALQVWVRVPSGAPPVNVRDNIGAPVTVTSADGWKKVQISVTGNGSYHIGLVFIAQNVSDNLDFYACFPQIENKAYHTSWTSGTRSPETLTIPTAGVLNPQEGAVMLRAYKPAYLNYNARLLWATEGTNRFGIHDLPDGNLAFALNSTDTQFSLGEPGLLAEKEWTWIVVSWKNGLVKAYVNGVLKEQQDYGSDQEAYIGDKLGIGCLPTGGQVFNGLIDDLAIFDYAPTDEEIQAWYEADAPIPITEHTTYLLRFDNDFVVGKGGARIVIETALSLDGGETWGAWQQATNGGSIPGIVADMDLSNAKLKTRATLEREDASVTPILHSLSILVIAQKGLMLIFDPLGEQYAVSGTWTSPVIDLTALVAEANSLITWDDEVPEDTNLTIEAQVSVDGETWGEYQALTKNNPLPAWEGYIRYRITLTSNVTRSKTPVIKSVSMDFVPQYATEGVWIGPPMDLRGMIVGDTAATFSKDTPEGTGVALYIGKGKSEEHVGEWEEIAQNGDPFDHDWFVRPKIVLTSDDGMVTPKANSIALNASQNGTRGLWTTPVIDATVAIDKSSGRVRLESVFNSGIVAAWSRSSEDGESWSDWVAADADGKLNHSPDNYVQVAAEITADAELVRLTIYFDGTSSATIISDNYFPGGQFYFATLLDWLIIVNGIDPPRKYNGGLFQDDEVKAKLTTDLEGEKNDLVYTSKLHGALGNDITIEYHDPEEAEQELSIDITLYAIKINLATDENGAITTTAEDIKNAIEEHDDAKEIVEVNYAPENDGSGVVTAMAVTPLSGGITSAIVGGDPPYAHYVAAHKNRLWLASGSRLYFSEILNFEEWPALNFIDISPNDGDVITGLLTYGDYLIITKGHSLWMLTGDGFETFAVRRIHADRGAYAPRSLITVNDLVSFVSDDGIYFTDFTQAVLISERIKPFWQTLNARRFNQAASWFYDHKLYVALPSANSMINDVVIVYDVLRQTFVGIYKGWKASCWAAFREGGRVYSYYGHSDKTMVTQIATGYSDNDKPYVMMWRSKEFDFNTPEIYKRFNLMLFQVSPAVVEAEITVRFYVDGAYIGEIDVPIPQGIGNMIHNIRVLASRAGVVGGHRIALEVAQEVLNNPVGIQLISLEYVAHGIKPTIFR